MFWNFFCLSYLTSTRRYTLGGNHCSKLFQFIRLSAYASLPQTHYLFHFQVIMCSCTGSLCNHANMDYVLSIAVSSACNAFLLILMLIFHCALHTLITSAWFMWHGILRKFKKSKKTTGLFMHHYSLERLMIPYVLMCDFDTSSLSMICKVAIVICLLFDANKSWVID